jgi:hypothetical protein
MEFLTLIAHYALWGAVWYAGVVYPVRWFRQNYRIRITHRRRAHA